MRARSQVPRQFRPSQQRREGTLRTRSRTFPELWQEAPQREGLFGGSTTTPTWRTSSTRLCCVASLPLSLSLPLFLYIHICICPCVILCGHHGYGALDKDMRSSHEAYIYHIIYLSCTLGLLGWGPLGRITSDWLRAGTMKQL